MCITLTILASCRVLSGSVGGLVTGITATLAVASQYEGGLNHFLINTVQDYAILAGTCCSFGFSLIGCIVGSLLTHNIKTQEDVDNEWMKLYDIDNPLRPWEVNLREDLKGKFSSCLNVMELVNKHIWVVVSDILTISLFLARQLIATKDNMYTLILYLK